MFNLSKPERLFLYIITLLYVSGVIWYAIPSVGLRIGRMSSLMLFICTGGVFYYTFRQRWHMPTLIWVALSFLFTLTLEIVGVATYKIFGAYYYYPTLQPQILKVPVLIGINWVMLAYGAVHLVSFLRLPGWLAGLIAAVAMTGFDYVMEPIAVKLQFWYWIGDQIPLQNFIAWFMIALVICIPLTYIRKRPRTALLGWFFVLQLFFFGALNMLL